MTSQSNTAITLNLYLCSVTAAIWKKKKNKSGPPSGTDNWLWTDEGQLYTNYCTARQRRMFLCCGGSVLSGGAHRRESEGELTFAGPPPPPYVYMSICLYVYMFICLYGCSPALRSEGAVLLPVPEGLRSPFGALPGWQGLCLTNFSNDSM